MNKSLIIIEKDNIIVNQITPIYKSRSKKIKIDGIETTVEEEKFIRDIKTIKWIKKDAITSVESFISPSNRVVKNKSIIYDKYSNRFFITDHSVNSIKESLSNNPVRIGFVKA